MGNQFQTLPRTVMILFQPNFSTCSLRQSSQKLLIGILKFQINLIKSFYLGGVKCADEYN